MSVALDYDKLVFDAVSSVLAQHIRARLVQTGNVLARGTPEGHARSTVRRWGLANRRAFYLLACTKDEFVTHARLSQGSGNGGSTSAFVGQTLRKQCVPVRRCDDPACDVFELQLFRRGHELFYSQLGVKLQLNTQLLAYSLGRTVTETTRGAVVAAQQNYEGACDAQEADTSIDEEARTEARRRLVEDMDEHAQPERKQAGLFEGGGVS